MFLKICNEYWKIKKYESVHFCSQMHGFILLNENGQLISNYVTWQDERSLEVDSNGDSIFSVITQEIKDDYKEISGMKPRPSLPFFNIISYCRDHKIKGQIKVATLADWFALVHKDSSCLAHDTLLAGLGFYDIKEKIISDKLLKLSKKYTGCDFVFNDSTNNYKQISGYMSFNKIKIPIHVGLGDLQCALFGADNKVEKNLSINIGTGSQVSLVKKNIGAPRSAHDYRPYFNNNFLWTFSHIPAGRVLNKYADFFNEISGGRCNLWKEISSLSLRDLEKSEILFDLNLFPSAFNYQGGGLISGLREQNFNKSMFISSLVRSFLDQYIFISADLSGHKKYDCKISGGIPLRYPLIKKYFEKNLKCAKKIIVRKECDETLLGLKNMIKI
jgi:sugar (pentulose or hexulose) kinase